MNTSFVSRITRRKVAVAAASIAAAGALAIPGVAWAQNAIPGGDPVAVSIPAAEATAACSTENLSDEEIQKLKEEGSGNSTAGSDVVASTESVAAAEVTEAHSVDPAPAVADTPDSTDAVMITASAC